MNDRRANLQVPREPRRPRLVPAHVEVPTRHAALLSRLVPEVRRRAEPEEEDDADVVLGVLAPPACSQGPHDDNVLVDVGVVDALLASARRVVVLVDARGESAHDATGRTSATQETAPPPPGSSSGTAERAQEPEPEARGAEEPLREPEAPARQQRQVPRQRGREPGGTPRQRPRPHRRVPSPPAPGPLD